MVLSFLSLHDEALRHIFLALGSDTIVLALPNEDTLLEDSCHDRSFGSGADSRKRTGADALSLASCSKRLNTIYRASVRTLSLRRTYSGDECARLWSRFPGVNALDFDLRDDDQGFSFHVYREDDPAVVWRGTPAVYPTGLVRNGIKSITLQYGGMHVLEMQAMLQNCNGLKALELLFSGVAFDRDAAEYTDEMCSFGLERHAATLEKLTFFHSCIRTPPLAEFSNSVDLRWLNLSRLSKLKDLAIADVMPTGDTFYQVAALTNLASLSLSDLKIDDIAVEAFFPSLPQLRSLNLDSCRKLTYRVLQWLPPQLDRLDISNTKILRKALTPLSTAAHGTKSVKTLVAIDEVNPRFGHFFLNYTGQSIESLALGSSTLKSSNDLHHILSMTPNLLKLCLCQIKGLNESIFIIISQLARLRELILRETDTSDQGLVLMANGPCSQSLRRLDLVSCPLIEDTEGASLLFS